jgi:hypothetical protein
MTSFKFEIGDRVKKNKGYIFRGIVKSRYEVDGGIRYDVQIDAQEAIRLVEHLSAKYKMSNDDVLELHGWIMNCDGMIHIFAENQLVLDV